MEVEIGRGKKGRRAYGFDDIAIVPSRRTRDAEDVDITWKLGPHTLQLPCLASAMDGVVDPAFAVTMGKLGGLAVLNLEGVQTRYENADEQLDRIAALPKETATRTMQQIYKEPVKPELVGKRIKEIKNGGVLAAASLTPQRVEEHFQAALDAGLDVLIIQGTVVSAEHVSTRVEPLDLRKFIEKCPVPVIVGGVASYATTLHLMRTGGDVSKAIALGADAVMIGSPLAAASEAPGRGYHWGMATFHPELPRGTRVKAGEKGSLEEILLGPAHENDGTLNLFGALRTSMATCGYETLTSFQKAEVMVAPALMTEGKKLQKEQDVGMG